MSKDAMQTTCKQLLVNLVVRQVTNGAGVWIQQFNLNPFRHPMMLSIHLRPSIHQQNIHETKFSISVLNWGNSWTISSIITRQISSYLCRASAVGKLRANSAGAFTARWRKRWKRWAQAKERSSCVQIKRSSIWMHLGPVTSAREFGFRLI